MKKTIILIRHATAEDSGLLGSDFDRKLIDKGVADSEMMGAWLSKTAYHPDLVNSSKAPRASETAEIIVEQLGSVPVIFDRDLYDGGAMAYLNALNKVDDAHNIFMLVGHNPDISFFVDYLCDENVGSMKKASIAVIEFNVMQWGEISRGIGHLKLYITPKEVRNAQ